MKRTILKVSSMMILLAVIALPAIGQSLHERVVSNNEESYRLLSSVHGGAGQMEFSELIGSESLSTNFLYLHAGKIYPKSGIGHHFHHSIEEMYVLLNGEAEFTINGHTSRLKAPVIVPNKLGDSHALYNPTDDTLRWLNFAVSSQKGKGDAFNLGDDRVGVTIASTPVFVYSRLKKDAMRSDSQPNSGDRVRSIRALGPEIFSTNWNHVDRLVIPSGNSTGPRQLKGIEEVYYVMNGSGTITLGGKTTHIEANDAFPVLLGESVTISNNESVDLELLAIGITVPQKKNLKYSGLASDSKAVVLQMDFVVTEENREAFEEMYHSIYVPAMKVQPGYLSSKLLRLYPEDEAKKIKAEPTKYNYQIQISFESEEDRRDWVKSEQHQIAWPAAKDLSEDFKWRGYDVMGDDQQ